MFYELNEQFSVMLSGRKSLNVLRRLKLFVFSVKWAVIGYRLLLQLDISCCQIGNLETSLSVQMLLILNEVINSISSLCEQETISDVRPECVCGCRSVRCKD